MYSTLKEYTSIMTTTYNKDEFSSVISPWMNGEQQQYYQQFNDDDTESVILGPYDVICGRGKLSFNNIGNRRFRIIIGMNVDEYNSINGRHGKGLFIRSLVDTFVNEIGVNFYKMNKNNTKLIELTRTQRREKIGHALRDMVSFQYSQQKQQQNENDKTIRSIEQDIELGFYSETMNVNSTAVYGI